MFSGPQECPSMKQEEVAPHSHLEAEADEGCGGWLGIPSKESLQHRPPPHTTAHSQAPYSTPPASLTGTPSWGDPGWAQETQRPMQGTPVPEDKSPQPRLWASPAPPLMSRPWRFPELKHKELPRDRPLFLDALPSSPHL